MYNDAVDVVIIHHNTFELTRQCIESLLESPQRTLIASITLVDNASTDGSAASLAALYPMIHLRRLEQPHSYAAACNIGASAGCAPNILLSNSDVVYDPTSLNAFTDHLKQYPHVGVCAAHQRYPDLRSQRSWGYVPGWGDILSTIVGIEFWHNRFGHSDRRWRAVPYCDGAALFCRRSAYEQLGGMDERFSFFAEDADLCYRMWLHGWHCHFLPHVQIIHYRGATRRRTLDQTLASERMIMAAKLQFVRHYHPHWERPLRWGYLFVAHLGRILDTIRYRLGELSDSDYELRRSIRRMLVSFLRESN